MFFTTIPVLLLSAALAAISWFLAKGAADAGMLLLRIGLTAVFVLLSLGALLASYFAYSHSESMILMLYYCLLSGVWIVCCFRAVSWQ